MIYEFVCPSCKSTKEISLSIAEYSNMSNSIRCDKCDSIMNRKYTPISTLFKGSGWTKSST